MKNVTPTAVISRPVLFGGSCVQMARPPYRYVSPMAKFRSAADGGVPAAS